MKKFTNYINEGKTSPWYRKGEILVCFNKLVTKEVQTYLLNKVKLTTTHLEPNINLDNVYIIDVPEGRENEIAELLKKKFPTDIEWAERRDLKWELRLYFTMFCSDELLKAGEEADSGDLTWKGKIETIIDILKLTSEDNYKELIHKYNFDSQ